MAALPKWNVYRQTYAAPSSGQSPHRLPRLYSQGSLCSLAPPLPNEPALLGFVWVCRRVRQYFYRGQSPHRLPQLYSQGSLRSLAPPLPNGPASLGSIWDPIFPMLGRFKGKIVKEKGTQHEPNEVGRVGRRRHKGADRLFALRRKERGADFGSTIIPLLD